MSTPIRSLTHPDAFRRLLQRRPLARHAGWSLYGMAEASTAAGGLSTFSSAPAPELSTGATSGRSSPVDDSTFGGSVSPDGGESVGAFQIVTGVVLSRRHVRRATTRNLMRRVWRAGLVQAGIAPWAGWCLVLRRTAPWVRDRFPSTQSDPMRRQLRVDFEQLLQHAARSVRLNGPVGMTPPAHPAPPPP